MNETPWKKGKTKDLYATANPDELVMHFRDDVAAYRMRKWGTITGKGAWSAAITHRLCQLLEQAGVPTQVLGLEAPDRLRVRKLQMIPLKFVVRNLAAGSLSQRMRIPEGTPLASTIVELLYQDDELGDPMVNDTHVRAFEWANEAQLRLIRQRIATINETLVPFLEERGLVLVDFFLEFGLQNGDMYLANELTPDTSRLWDMASSESLDKDRFRQGLDLVREGYQEVYHRVCG